MKNALSGFAIIVLLLLGSSTVGASCPPGQESLVIKTEDSHGIACGTRAKPKKKVDPIPPYPERPEQRQYRGLVILQALVNQKGRVDSIDVISEKPENLGLADSAIAAVKQWRFKPAKVNKRPVDSYETVVVSFNVGNPP